MNHFDLFRETIGRNQKERYMADTRLNGKTIAILAANGFEHSELFEPKKALEQAGAKVEIVSLKTGEIKSWKDKNWGEALKVDRAVGEVKSDFYDGLVLPGGVINPDLLRADKKAVAFVKEMATSGKPIAAICHGPWTLVEADVVAGRRMTSYSSIKTDLINAGADWEDKEVVSDQGFITSRKPDDLPAFNRKMIEEFAEGLHKNRVFHARQESAQRTIQ